MIKRQLLRIDIAQSKGEHVQPLQADSLICMECSCSFNYGLPCMHMLPKSGLIPLELIPSRWHLDDSKSKISWSSPTILYHENECTNLLLLFFSIIDSHPGVILNSIKQNVQDQCSKALYTLEELFISAEDDQQRLNLAGKVEEILNKSKDSKTIHDIIFPSVRTKGLKKEEKNKRIPSNFEDASRSYKKSKKKSKI